MSRVVASLAPVFDEELNVLLVRGLASKVAFGL